MALAEEKQELKAISSAKSMHEEMISKDVKSLGAMLKDKTQNSGQRAIQVVTVNSPQGGPTLVTFVVTLQ